MKENLYFDEFQLNALKRRLLRNGVQVHLNPKAFDLLLALVENSGRLLSKDDLYRMVWHDRIVEESNLSVNMARIRKALGETAKQPRYITTISGEGYRFAADVREGEFKEETVEQRTFARIIVEEIDGDPDIATGSARDPVSKKGRFDSRQLAVVAGMIALLGLSFGGYFLKDRLAGATAAPASSLEIRRLTTSGKVSAVGLAADGRFMVFAQKEAEGESLWLRQIETGSQTRITAVQKIEYLGLTVSPDGNHVYASVYLENLADTPLWKIPILGGAPAEIPNVVTASAIAFSPDGRQMTYTESHRPETHLYVSDSTGENARLLLRAHREQRYFPFEQSSPTAWSPDGRHVAVVFHEQKEGSSPAGILLVDPADGSEKILVAPRWAFVEHVTWLDGDTLAFTGWDDEWSNQIWTFSRQSGETRQVTSGLQKYSWLAASGGKLLTAQVDAISTLYTVDFAEDVQSLAPRELLRESGNVFYIATNKPNEIFYSSRTTGSSEVWRVDKDGTNPVQITSDGNVVYGLAVCPADDTLFFPSNQNGRLELWTANADGRNLRRVTDGLEPIYPDCAEDGTIVFQDGDYAVARLSRGATRPVILGKGLKPAISPDGTQVAFFTMERGKWFVRIAAIDSGETLKDIVLPTNIKERRMRWHPSGRFLSLIYHSGDRLQLLLLPLDGGEFKRVDDLGKGAINTFAWSHDGKQLLYSVTSQTQDAVLISGF